VKTVHTAATEVEAVMLKGLLEDAGIPVLLRSHLVPGYNTRIPPGWGDLFVPDERLREAKTLIAEYLAAVSEGERP
jgi:hypothetical protein